jgi:hypothetical protein
VGLLGGAALLCSSSGEAKLIGGANASTVL